MQAYDLIMLIVIGMATIFGALKGFAWQVASLASVVVSYIVAYRFRFQVAEMITAKPPWNQFLAMLILYVSTSFVIWVGFRLLSSTIDRVRLKEFDRHLGAGFGLAKGAIYCLLITMFAMSLLGPTQQAAICHSRSGYYISVALDRSIGILPKEIHDVVGPYLSDLDDKLNNHDGHDHDAGVEPDEPFQLPDAGSFPSLGNLGIQGLPDFVNGLGGGAEQRTAAPAGSSGFAPSQGFGSDAPAMLPQNQSNIPQLGSAGSTLQPQQQPAVPAGNASGIMPPQFNAGVMPPQGFGSPAAGGNPTSGNSGLRPTARTSQNGGFNY